MSASLERLPQLGNPRHGMQTIGYSFPDQVKSGDPREAAHVFFDRPINQATAGIWESQAGTVRFDSYPFDEFCVVVQGDLALVGDDGAEEAFRAGDAFLVRKGWAGLWVMHSAVRKYYVELKDG